MTNEESFCPLSMIRNSAAISPCVQEKCAWWIKYPEGDPLTGRCIVAHFFFWSTEQTVKSCIDVQESDRINRELQNRNPDIGIG